MVVIRFFIVLIASLVLLALASNLWVLLLGKNRLLRVDPIEVRECAIVLGAGVRGEKLSGVLRGRMEKAIELYQKKLVKKILVSGDGTDPHYNETNAMQRFAIRNAVPAEDLLSDPHGVSTYVSIVRAHSTFKVQSAYIISQEFHLARAVWLGNALGMDSWGIPTGSAHDEWYYMFREVPARMKDFVLFVVRYSPSDPP